MRDFPSDFSLMATCHTSANTNPGFPLYPHTPRNINKGLRINKSLPIQNQKALLGNPLTSWAQGQSDQSPRVKLDACQEGKGWMEMQMLEEAWCKKNKEKRESMNSKCMPLHLKNMFEL